MARLRTQVNGERIVVELTIDELDRLLRLQRLPHNGPDPLQRGPAALLGSPNLPVDSKVRAEAALAAAIHAAWPKDLQLPEEPTLTTRNVLGFLTWKLLNDDYTTSTAEVALRFFGRQLSPTSPKDSAILRRVWYCVREAKRDIERAIGGHWEDATDVPVRAGTSKAWRYVAEGPRTGSEEIMSYREGR
jgi:hypothetical protein